MKHLNPPPAKIAEIIRIVNLVSPELALPDIGNEFYKMIEISEREQKAAKRKREVKAISDMIKAWIQDLPEALVEYISKPEPFLETEEDFALMIFAETLTDSRRLPAYYDAVETALNQIQFPQPKAWGRQKSSAETFADVSRAVRRYNFMRESRDKLRWIIKLVGAANRLESVAFSYFLPISVSGEIMISESGIVVVAKDKFADAVEGIDATRIRSCEVCRVVYWAGRKDQPCCSTACSHALRNRRYRAKRLQGYYQGARLTKKEKAALLRGAARGSARKGNENHGKRELLSPSMATQE